MIHAILSLLKHQWIITIIVAGIKMMPTIDIFAESLCTTITQEDEIAIDDNIGKIR